MGLSTALLGLGLAGAGVSAFGQYESGQATSQMAAYQAQVAQNNAAIAQQNAAWEAGAGESQVAAEGMKTAAKVASTKAAQGASGVDVNTGSTAAVRTAETELGALDAMTIRSNTAKKTYGYEVASGSDIAQAGLLTQEGSQATTAGDIGAMGTLLSGASSVGSKYANWSLGSSNKPLNLLS